MKKSILTKMTFLALAFLCLGTGCVWGAATTIDATVKATYINGSATTTSYGEVTTAYCGYNIISGGKVELANSKWGVNNIAYLQVDASAVPVGTTITNVTLTADLQQISKRGLTYGCGYNSSVWSSTLTWDTADRSITTCGSTVSTSKSRTADLTGQTFDITNALKNDADKIATVLVYQTVAGGGYITNISAKVTYSLTQQANYTVKYMYGETEIKDATTHSGDVDGVPTLEESDKAAVYSADGQTKYVYASDDASSKTIASDGSTVVTVNFNTAAVYTVTVKDQFGNTLGSNNVFDGENTTFYLPQFALVGGKFYTTPTASEGTVDKYGVLPFSGVTANKEVTISYTEDANQNVVYFSEAENISTLTSYNDQYTRGRMSNGAVGYGTAGAVITNLPAGVYTVTSSTRSGSTNFFAGEATVLALSSGGSVVTTTGDQFILTESTDITVSAGSSKIYFDYVIIRKTGEATYTKDLSTTGFATFSASVNVTVPDGTFAYKATVSGSVVALTKVEGVIPANTGVILYNSEKPSSVTLTGTTDDATADFNDNELIPTSIVANRTVNGATDASSYTYYALNKNTPNFGYISADLTLSDNKAYLKVEKPSSTAAMNLSIGFSNGFTGLEIVDAESEDNVIYNVYGVRVNEDYKGIVIVNGKKYLNK